MGWPESERPHLVIFNGVQGRVPTAAREAQLDLLRNIASTTLLNLLFLLTAVGLEHVGPLERYSLRARVPGFIMSGVGTFVSFALIPPLSWAWGKLGLTPFIVIPLWRWLEPLGFFGFALEVAILLAWADFLGYWLHRAEHTWLWRIHAVHHAPRELHAANDIAHPLQAVYSFFLISIPMSLIQIDSRGTPFLVGGMVMLASIYIHSPVEWHFGQLRKLFVDNRFHRIHHSIEERHFDKNFGTLFSVWDRLFGTEYEPANEWPAVGLADIPPPRSLIDYLQLPFRVRQEGHAFSEDPVRFEEAA